MGNLFRSGFRLGGCGSCIDVVGVPRNSCYERGLSNSDSVFSSLLKLVYTRELVPKIFVAKM